MKIKSNSSKTWKLKLNRKYFTKSPSHPLSTSGNINGQWLHVYVCMHQSRPYLYNPHGLLLRFMLTYAFWCIGTVVHLLNTLGKSCRTVGSVNCQANKSQQSRSVYNSRAMPAQRVKMLYEYLMRWCQYSASFLGPTQLSSACSPTFLYCRQWKAGRSLGTTLESA